MSSRNNIGDLNERVRTLAKMARPANTRFSILLLIALNLSHGAIDLKTLWQAMYIIILYAFAASINNLVDLKVDIANHNSANPLVAGEIPKFDLLTAGAFQVLAFVVIQFILPQPVTILAGLGALIIAVTYSLKPFDLQSRGWLAPLSLCLWYGGLPVVLSGVGSSLAMAQTFAVSCAGVFALILAKDYKDETGDRKYGKRTPLVRYGARIVAIAATAGAFLAAAFWVLNSSFTPLLPRLTIGIIFVSSIRYIHSNRNTMPWLKNCYGLILIMMVASLTVVRG